MRKIKVGPIEDPQNYMGPVINEASMKSILGYIDAGKKEGRLVAGGKRAEGDGYFIEPTVIADVDRKARIFQEEIFGPVLAVSKAKDFDDALAMANDTEFGLTGAVYSQNPDENRARRRRISRRQPLHEPQMHRRDGGRASVRRLQYVRHGFKIRRPGLPAAVPASENHSGKRRRHEITRPFLLYRRRLAGVFEFGSCFCSAGLKTSRGSIPAAQGNPATLKGGAT